MKLYLVSYIDDVATIFGSGVALVAAGSFDEACEMLRKHNGSINKTTRMGSIDVPTEPGVLLWSDC